LAKCLEWGKECNEILDEVWGEGAIVLDYDSKVLLFWGGQLLLDDTALIPHLVDLMRTTTWVGWDVCWAKWGMLSIAEYLSLPRSVVCQSCSNPSEEFIILP